MSKKVLGLSLIIFILDQVSKAIISAFIKLNDSLSIIKNFFSLTYINNNGASFGILQNGKVFLIILSLIAILILIRYLNSFKNNTKNIFGFGLLIGGILGNLSDRLLFGYVRDFLDFKILNYNFPVFNLADTFIVIGVFLLIIAIIKGEDKSGSSSRKSK